LPIKNSEIVIISYNCLEYLKSCIDSIRKTSGIKISVVDNGSSDGTVEYLQSERNINTIYNSENMGYGKAANQILLNSNSEFFIVSNADVIYEKHTIDTLINFISKNKIAGVCGPQQKYLDGHWQNSYGDLPSFRLAIKDLFFISLIERLIRKTYWPTKFDDHIMEVEYIDGAVYCISREAIKLTNGFDEDYFFYTEEADLSKRVSNCGLKNVFIPSVNVIHHRGGSNGGNITNEKSATMLINSKILYCKKHLNKIERKFFLKSQYLHNYIMKLVWELFGFVSKEVSKNKIIYYRLMINAWKNGK